MKKIMGAVLAAAMLAGTVTAADISFAYKGSNYFRLSERKLAYQADGTEADGTETDWRKGGANQYLRADCMGVGLSTENAGVYIDYDTEKGGLKLDEYYGWLNFGLPLGSLQVTTGRWNGRYVNRVITDKYNLDGAEFELHKPGVINGIIGKDSDNLTLGELGLVGAWTIADALPGTLMVKLGLVKYSGYVLGKDDKDKDVKVGNWNPDRDTVNIEAGLTGEVAYQLPDVLRVNLAVRTFNTKSYSFGAWISPILSDALQMTLGGTFATGKFYTTDWSDRKTEWGVDFRLRLQVNDDLSLTTMNNISSGYDIAEDGNKGLLWNMLNVTYAFADNLKASFTVQSEVDVYCPHYADKADWTLIMSPSLIIQASERVRVTTSARAYMPDIRNYALKNIMLTIPVIFSFNY